MLEKGHCHQVEQDQFIGRVLLKIPSSEQMSHMFAYSLLKTSWMNG